MVHIVNGSDLFCLITAEIDHAIAQTLRQLCVTDKRIPRAETLTAGNNSSTTDSIDMSKVYSSKD